MHTDIHTPLQNTRSKCWYMGLPTVWKKLVRGLCKGKKPSYSTGIENPPSIPQWATVVFHDMLCSESIHHAGGVEYISMDMETIPRFMQEPQIPPMAFREELDRSAGNNYRCGLFDKSSPTLDCRYYYEEVVIHEDEGHMVGNGRIQRPYVDQENDRPTGTSDQLPSQVFLKEGSRDER